MLIFSIRIFSYQIKQGVNLGVLPMFFSNCRFRENIFYKGKQDVSEYEIRDEVLEWLLANLLLSILWNLVVFFTTAIQIQGKNPSRCENISLFSFSIFYWHSSFQFPGNGIYFFIFSFKLQHGNYGFRDLAESSPQYLQQLLSLLLYH